MAGRARQRTPPQPAPGHGVTEHAAPGRKETGAAGFAGVEGAAAPSPGVRGWRAPKKPSGQAPPPPETPAAGAGGMQAAQAVRRGAEGRRRRAGGGGRAGERGYVPQCVNLSSIVSPWRGRRKAPPFGGAPARLVRAPGNFVVQNGIQAAAELPDLAGYLRVGGDSLQ